MQVPVALNIATMVMCLITLMMATAALMPQIKQGLVMMRDGTLWAILVGLIGLTAFVGWSRYFQARARRGQEQISQTQATVTQPAPVSPAPVSPASIDRTMAWSPGASNGLSHHPGARHADAVNQHDARTYDVTSPRTHFQAPHFSPQSHGAQISHETAQATSDGAAARGITGAEIVRVQSSSAYDTTHAEQYYQSQNPAVGYHPAPSTGEATSSPASTTYPSRQPIQPAIGTRPRRAFQANRSWSPQRELPHRNRTQ